MIRKISGLLSFTLAILAGCSMDGYMFMDKPLAPIVIMAFLAGVFGIVYLVTGDCCYEEDAYYSYCNYDDAI